MKRVIMVNSQDTVATLLNHAEAGDSVHILTAEGKEAGTVKIGEPISMGHKVALLPMKEGDKVIKYGAVIGQATRPIRVGDHVHVHNMKSLRLAIPLNVPANTK